MKILEDTELEIESSDSLSNYLMTLHHAIDDETHAIAFYDKMLSNSKIPTSTKEIIKEILDDEKDHLVILTELLNDEVSEEFPNYGDTDDEGIDISEE